MFVRYSLAPNPVFWSIQGEGHLRGFQMAFIRLAGCSVGCSECDTDYKKDDSTTSAGLAQWADDITPKEQRDRWVWITGGEPTDYDLGPLLFHLREKNFSIALATSGKRRFIPPVDWLSVSPHSTKISQRYGSEVKLVDGLNGLDIDEWMEANPDSQTDFMYRYVQPLSIGGIESKDSLHRCLEFLKRHPNWSLSRQDHHIWDVP